MKVWIIDEDQEQRETYSEFLSDIFNGVADVIPAEPLPTVADMSYVASDPDTVMIVLDERLKDTGIANYLGIDLAKYFRTIKTKLPIYILTNHPEDSDDFDGSEWSVDEIIDKGDVANKREILKARLLRRIDTYTDILGEREKRFESLLRKSINDRINQSELEEYNKLQFIRAASVAAEEIGLAEAIEEKINEHETWIKEIENGEKHDDGPK